MELTRSALFWTGIISSGIAAVLAVLFAGATGSKAFIFPAGALLSAALVLWVVAPGQADHRFRRMSITHSMASRSPIPRHADR
jgi:hypothetical protein